MVNSKNRLSTVVKIHIKNWLNTLLYNINCILNKHKEWNKALFYDAALSLLLLQGSRDNMSIVIVAFDAAPKICEAAKQKEVELDGRIENKIKGML